VIGITSEDMYPKTLKWAWGFAYRIQWVGLVSAARMDPRTYGLEPNPGLLQRRIRKYAVRYGVLLSHGQSEVRDPRSALYDAILGVDDLDFMQATVAPAPLTSEEAAWLERASAACARAMPHWREIDAALGSADEAGRVELFARWSDVDRDLAAELGAIGPGAPSLLRTTVLRPLNERSLAVRQLSQAGGVGTRDQIKHIQSLSYALHAGFLENGSRACGRAT
jgi:hypothetical protein